MRRLHLFEFEDQAWCPRFIRETTTDFLHAIYKLFQIYEPAYQKISEILDKTHVNTIIDCCSGSGGPIRQLRDYLDKLGKTSVTINLTDKYPNTQVFNHMEESYPKRIIGHMSSIDASQFPSSLKGMRTFFSSFHHFTPDTALKILQDAVNNKAPIAIFESSQRHPLDFLRVLLSPVFMPLIVPFAKRLTLYKFIFTYVIPITPFTNFWDYFVSCLRSYSPNEMLSLVNRLNAPDYTWEIGRLWSKKGKCHIPYLIGYKNL